MWNIKQKSKRLKALKKSVNAIFNVVSLTEIASAAQLDARTASYRLIESDIFPDCILKSARREFVLYREDRLPEIVNLLKKKKP